MDNKVRLKGTIQKIFGNTTQTGKRVINFTILWQDEKRKYYFKCNAWEDLAQQIEALGEGGVIRFEGSLKVDSWEKEGRKIFETKVLVSNIIEQSAGQQQAPNDAELF